MKFKVKPNENGITLIALIISVIILVILAAISIKAIYDSQMVDYAANGAINYSEQENRESGIVNTSASLIYSALGKDGSSGSNSSSSGSSSDNTGIDFANLSDSEKESLIGKYVNYTPTSRTFSDHVGETYSGDTGSNNVELSTNTSLKWRILFVDSNKLTLISDDVANEGFYLESYQGYNNGVLLLNNACKALYSNATLGATGRSIKIEDIERVSSYDKTTDSDYGTEFTPSNKYYPSIFAQEKTGYINSAYGTTYGQSEQGTSYISQTAALQATTLKGKWTYYTYTMSTSYMTSTYLELFRYQAGTTTNLSTYWLASRCVTVSSTYAGFYVFYVSSGAVDASWLCNSGDDGEFSFSYAVRPVVEINLASVSIGATGSGTSSDPYSITAK